MTSAELPAGPPPALVVRSRRAASVGGLTLPLRDAELRRILPHRHPFALLDRVDKLEPGRRATGSFAVTRNDGVFEGHFPERPVLPGVLLVEALAQLSGVLVWATAVGAPDGVAADPHGTADPQDTGGVEAPPDDPRTAPLGVLAGVKRMRFRDMVVPGDVVALESVLGAQLGGVAEFTVSATVDKRVVADGTLQLALRA